ncbi:MAG: hypothetical protein HY294_10630 [Candidatus Rokubacteria bacterium]|nr:hypothetical protein [Candidatus Rokubacteria bacterium]MBI3826439.1 hypothetical protein [Candidatus Rokubacteria bacterium]
MPRTANVLPRRGTRFVIWLQERHVQRGAREVVWVDTLPRRIRRGPADAELRVVDAIGKKTYRVEDADAVRFRARPPYRGRTAGAPRPDANGHYDRLAPSAAGVDSANVFAVLKSVHAIWEHHFGHRLSWVYGVREPVCLEVIPHVESDNSWSGPGYVEYGFPRFDAGHEPPDRADPFAENFDAIAHEMGHVLLKGVIGNLPERRKTLEHRAHEEACADLVAAVASLNFDGEVNRIFAATRGRLFSDNTLSRLAERSLPAGRPARVLFNGRRLSGLRRARRRGDKHTYSLAFSGAAYDVLCGLYAGRLMDRGLVPDRRAALARGPRRVLAEIERRLPGRPGAAARESLLDARDEFARLLAAAWHALGGTVVSYASAVAALVAADRYGSHRGLLRWAFRNRGIKVPR